jgi:hypothetical protein
MDDGIPDSNPKAWSEAGGLLHEHNPPPGPHEGHPQLDHLDRLYPYGLLSSDLSYTNIPSESQQSQICFESNGCYDHGDGARMRKTRVPRTAVVGRNNRVSPRSWMLAYWCLGL